MGYGKFWGHEGHSIKLQHNGWNIEVGKFTFTDPEDWAWLVSWRYRMSRNTIVPGIWTEKNRRGRKLETRCFTSQEEAREAAIAAASS